MQSHSQLVAVFLAVPHKQTDAITLLKSMEKLTIVNDVNKTLFDVALEANNLPAIDFLATQHELLSFSSPLSKDHRLTIKYQIEAELSSFSLHQFEQRLQQTYGANVSFLRTPLLQACRLGHRHAIKTLLQNKASLDDTNALGLSPFSLCMQSSDNTLLNYFIELCKTHQVNIVVTQQTLESCLHDKDTLAILSDIGEMDAATKRFLLAIWCAHTEPQRVAELLNSGIKINTAITKKLIHYPPPAHLTY